MNIVVIDGQGGKIGKTIIESLRNRMPDAVIKGIGTNVLATQAMLKAGATAGATGENPVIVACRDADVITGPIGIIAADSLMGEITPKMAEAVGSSYAKKVLLPQEYCIHVVGVEDRPLADYIRMATDEIVKSAQSSLKE